MKRQFAWNAHQLEEDAKTALSFTPKGLISALKHAKGLGYRGMTLVPLLFHPDLTAEVAGEIAEGENMQIDTCLFLPGDQFNPHSKDGKKKARDAVIQQGAYQQHWFKRKVGGGTLWGPSGQGFMGEFDLDGYKDWVYNLSLVAADLDLLAAIEVLNQFEQSKAPMNIFDLTANVIDEVTINGRVGLHYDTVHAFMRMGHEKMLDFYRRHRSKIFVLELANKDRLPFDQDCGIDFAAHVSETQNLHPSVRLGAEAFCTTVVKELKLDFYNTPFLGRVARERNAAYLKERGWM